MLFLLFFSISIQSGRKSLYLLSANAKRGILLPVANLCFFVIGRLAGGAAAGIWRTLWKPGGWAEKACEWAGESLRELYFARACRHMGSERRINSCACCFSGQKKKLWGDNDEMYTQ